MRKTKFVTVKNQNDVMGKSWAFLDSLGLNVCLLFRFLICVVEEGSWGALGSSLGSSWGGSHTGRGWQRHLCCLPPTGVLSYSLLLLAGGLTAQPAGSYCSLEKREGDEVSES